MPYVSRDANGYIQSIHKSPTGDATEEISGDDPEVVTFLSGGESGDALRWELLVSDLAMARLAEDLVDVLIQKNILALTELPSGAQRKLLRRQRLRDKLNSVEGMISDEGSVI